ncbi:MAG: DNA adenine methylase [Methylophilus sp.]|nr:DNA adenine methylase [Methylophilus sp.]
MSTSTRSVLRYPGSKARFVDFIEKTIKLNKPKFDVFAEPFCGGASVSIALLERGIVENVALNDADPLVAHLWDCVFCPSSADWLIEKVKTIPLTLDEWKYQKNLEPSTPRDAALKCLYLNRTSFNGIIHKAGPVGGWKQSNRTLGARFNREKLAIRIRELSLLSDRVISVSNNDWKSFCQRFNEAFDTFFYFDPPYFHKAEALYGYFFNQDEHSALRDYIKKLESPWLLSYDDALEIRSLYLSHVSKIRHIDSTYSAHPMGGSSFIGRELIFTNLLRLPSATKNPEIHLGLSIHEFKKKNINKRRSVSNIVDA